MRNSIIALGLLLSVCVPSPANAQGTASRWNWWSNKPAAPSAQAQTAITDFSGRLSVSRERLPKALPVLKAPFALQSGDIVRTGGDGSAVLRLQDHSEIRLDPGTEFVLREDSPAGVSLILNIGKLWAQVTKGRTRSFEVRTPSAVAAVRGTSFSVEVTAARNGITEVYEGAVAVEALKNNAPSGHSALLLAGQHIEASGGGLGEMRAIVKPANPQTPGTSAPRQKAELEKKLKTLTAAAAARHDADQAAAASAALASGDAAKMRAVARTLESAAHMSPEQTTLLAKAFDKGRSLSDLGTPFARTDSQDLVKRQVSQAMTSWNVNRELGLQMRDQTSRSLMAKGAISASASQASAQVAMAAYQQQYTQSYLNSQQAVQPAGAGGASAMPSGRLQAGPSTTNNLPATSVAGAPPPAMTTMQIPMQAAVSLQPTTSPTSPVYKQAPPASTTANPTTNPTTNLPNTGNSAQPAPILAPPPTGTGTCTCTLTGGCSCH